MNSPSSSTRNSSRAPVLTGDHKLDYALDLLAALLAAGLLGIIAGGHAGPARVLLTLGFAAFAPGRAVVSNWHSIASWSDVGTSMAVSLGVVTLAATVSLWVHLWNPVGLFQAEAYLTLIGLAVGAIRRRPARNLRRDRNVGRSETFR